METHFIIIQVSAKTYWGFQYKVPLIYALNISQESLARETQMYMKNFFDIHNLEELKQGVDNLNLHIHNPILSTDKVIYACDHDHTDM
jgi:hypothetical protein